MADWLEKWGVGLGLMGEQGAESIHTSTNQIKKVLFERLLTDFSVLFKSTT